MNSLDSTNIFLQMFKRVPWWVWGIIVISYIFSNSKKKSKRKRNHYNYKNNDSLLDKIADKIINSIIAIFKSKKINHHHYSPTNNYTSQKPIDIELSMSEIDQMSGRDFEKYLEKLFIKLKYRVNRVGTCSYNHRGDFGADLIVEKDGIKTAIQAKCHSSCVGISSIREVLGAINYYNCQKAMVVTNSYFTNDAQIQAIVSNIKLWNRDKLINVISELNTKQNSN